MKFTPLRASLLALALFGVAGPASAAASAGERPTVLAQAETQDFDAIRKFLSGGKDVGQLSDERLQQRLTRAKRFLKTDGLPEDLAQELQQEVAALEAEAGRRQQAAAEPAPAPAEEPQQAEQPPEAAPAPEAAPEPSQQAAQEPPPPEPQPQPEAQVEQPAAPEATQQQAQQEQPQAEPEAAPQAGQGSDEIAAFLASVRPVSELSEDQIRAQMRRATELARTKGISKDQRRALRDVIRDARTALKGGGEGQQQAQQPEAAQPEAQQQAAPQPEVQQQAQPQPPAAEQPQVQTQQAPQVDPALERQARAILDDKVDVTTLKRRELRQRLNGIRDLLATNQLSPETRDALRQKLARERQVLRAQVRATEEGDRPAQQQEAQQQQGGGTTTNNTTANTTVTNNNVTVNNNTTVTNTDVRVALRDRRPPEQLDEDELIRRIDIYRDVVRDDRYDAEERQAWRRALERDRRYLRRQMLEERQQRAERLRSGQIEFNVRIGDEYDPDYDVPDDVFAAEVEDEELAEVLAAPPRRKVQRRYTVEDLERSPEARQSVARIEIDTVHFGFGEGFLREEEIDKLDRIAQVLESILAKNPEEVFLLEGHTDAVGSDAANLALSRQRAQAVKEALTTYYVIPAENLKTAGLGERYLKIPTQQAEAENRRVSLARITALVGQAD